MDGNEYKEPTISLVIARYNEDVKWLHAFDAPNYRIFLYNKGKTLDSTDLPKNTTLIRLSNVGREAHTYLYHIISNYDKLTSYVVFLQGRPFDHIKNNGESLKQTIDKFVLESIVDTIHYFYEYREPIDRYKELHIRKCMESLGLHRLNDRLIFSAGAQYIVHKSLILNKSLNFYTDLFNYLKDDNIQMKTKIYTPLPFVPFQISNLNAYAMERLWPYIFYKSEQLSTK